MKKAVKIQGGLGNQMFQYAFAKGMDEPVVLDVSWFSSKCVVTPRNLGLKKMSCSLSYEHPLRRFFLRNIRKCVACLGIKSFYPDISDDECRKGPSLFRSGRYIGYFQDEIWFRHKRSELEKEFVPREALNDSCFLRWKERIEGGESVSVHVRRGDYLNSAFGWVSLGMDYYREAISHVRKVAGNGIEIFVFSDDERYVRTHVIPQIGGEFVDAHVGAVGDLMLMKSCKHNIIANSSFSWWGAWLNSNPAKVVVAPSRWNVDEKLGAAIPGGWHLI